MDSDCVSTWTKPPRVIAGELASQAPAHAANQPTAVRRSELNQRFERGHKIFMGSGGKPETSPPACLCVHVPATWFSG